MGSMLSAVKPGPDQTPKTNDEDPAERNAPGGGPRQPRPKPINTGKRGRAGQSTETGSARKTGSLRPAVEKVKFKGKWLSSRKVRPLLASALRNQLAHQLQSLVQPERFGFSLSLGDQPLHAGLEKRRRSVLFVQGSDTDEGHLAAIAERLVDDRFHYIRDLLPVCG